MNLFSYFHLCSPRLFRLRYVVLRHEAAARFGQVGEKGSQQLLNKVPLPKKQLPGKGLFLGAQVTRCGGTLRCALFFYFFLSEPCHWTGANGQGGRWAARSDAC